MTGLLTELKTQNKTGNYTQHTDLGDWMDGRWVKGAQLLNSSTSAKTERLMHGRSGDSEEASDRDSAKTSSRKGLELASYLTVLVWGVHPQWQNIALLVTE
jgi:hypothetical protein